MTLFPDQKRQRSEDIPDQDLGQGQDHMKGESQGHVPMIDSRSSGQGRGQGIEMIMVCWEDAESAGWHSLELIC